MRGSPFSRSFPRGEAPQEERQKNSAHRQRLGPLPASFISEDFIPKAEGKLIKALCFFALISDQPGPSGHLATQPVSDIAGDLNPKVRSRSSYVRMEEEEVFKGKAPEIVFLVRQGWKKLRTLWEMTLSERVVSSCQGVVFRKPAFLVFVIDS